MTEDLADRVEEVIRESETKRHTVTSSALDFSYLVAIDRDTGTARMRFQLDEDAQIPETLFLIQLVCRGVFVGVAWAWAWAWAWAGVRACVRAGLVAVVCAGAGAWTWGRWRWHAAAPGGRWSGRR